MLDKLNLNFVKALIRRDLWKYFTNPTGYVFITLFIFLSAVSAFWQDRFFLNNLANLEQLNALIPYLLLFFVPALTMGVWADERRQATDELLLTLPATSLEVVLGKYLAVLGVYTASLVLSSSHVLVLAWLGNPDLGIMFANYVGYWLLGGSLIAVGMTASLLTSNVTVAFILGAGLCGFLVFIKALFGLISNGLANAVSSLGVIPHFQDFASGMISLSGVIYFLSVAAFGIYLNVLLVERRHWPRKMDAHPTWLHYMVRATALIILVGSFATLTERIGFRLDTTSERLHSLSGQTLSLVNSLDEDRPVFIQAFISPEVPEPYVQTRANLLSTLTQLDSIGGSKVQVRIERSSPYSSAAREAREKFGITSRQIPNISSARAGFSDVFLGIAFTCGAEEEVLPFVDRGLSVEYELARSMRVVANTARKKIGLVTTEAKLFGGFDFQTFRSSPAWPVVEELRKQYEVIQVNPTGDLPNDLDGLVIALPSSLSQEELDAIKKPILAGTPTLLMVDPMPVINLGLSPSEQAGANQNPFMRNQGPPPKQKGDIQTFLKDMGISWDKSAVVWDAYNPHPDLEHLPAEVVFIGRGNENEEAFNPNTPATAALQELVMLYPGALAEATGDGFDFQPLVKTSVFSGRFVYQQLVQRSFLGMSLNRNLPHRPDGGDYVTAALIEGTQKTEITSTEEGSSEEKTTAEQQLKVVVIADLDFISEQFFRIREQGPQNLNFDNVTFFLNSIDILVGDESFVALRNKRVKHRTLRRFEAQTQTFVANRIREEKQAEADAEAALADAQRRLDQRVNEVQKRSDLDDRTKQIMARNLQEVESRRFEVLKANIENDKEAKVATSKENMEEQLRRIQSTIKTFAVLLPPIPVFIMGIMIFIRRRKREEEGEAVTRMLRD